MAGGGSGGEGGGGADGRDHKSMPLESWYKKLEKAREERIELLSEVSKALDDLNNDSTYLNSQLKKQVRLNAPLQESNKRRAESKSVRHLYEIYAQIENEQALQAETPSHASRTGADISAEIDKLTDGTKKLHDAMTVFTTTMRGEMDQFSSCVRAGASATYRA